MIIDDNILDALRLYRLNHQGSTASAARSLGISPQHFNKLLNHTKKFMLDETWEKVYPFIAMYLRDNNGNIINGNGIIGNGGTVIGKANSVNMSSVDCSQAIVEYRRKLQDAIMSCEQLSGDVKIIVYNIINNTK